MSEAGGAGAGAPPGVEGAIKGRVSGLQQRFVEGGAVIWNFRVERQDDAGNPLPRVAVQLSGVGFDGAFNEGDWVKVDGRWEDGTLHTDAVKNLSTQATVRAKQPRVAKAVAVAVVALIAVGIVVILLIAVLGGGGDAESDFERRSEQNRQEALERFCRDAPDHPSCK